MADLSLNEKIDLLLQKTQEEEVKNTKKPKRVFKKKGQRTISKKNLVYVLMLSENGSIEGKWLPIIDGVVKVGDVEREATPPYIGFFKGKTPIMLIPVWSMTPVPLSGMENFELLKDDIKADAQKIIVKRMEKEKAGLKGKVGGMKIILIILGVAVVAYLFLGGNSP